MSIHAKQSSLLTPVDWERSVCAKNAPFCATTFFTNATYAPHVLKLHGIISAKKNIRLRQLERKWLPYSFIRQFGTGSLHGKCFLFWNISSSYCCCMATSQFNVCTVVACNFTLLSKNTNIGRDEIHKTVHYNS